MSVTALPSIRRNGGFLPLAPFREIVQRDHAAGHATALLGRETLRRILNGLNETVELDTADRYLCATGRHLRDVWPWLYDEEQVAADIAESHAALRRIQYRNCRAARLRVKQAHA